MANINSSLGGPVPGVLREHAVFPESGIMKAPTGWSLEEASTLPCAAVTAWNALRGIKSGDSVSVQGTGEVSLFALQFAKMAGACVVATTSSAEKERLKRLGADGVVNSKGNPAWGEIAKKLSPRGEGIDYVMEVCRAVTINQNFKAVKLDGTIVAIGFRAGMTDEVQPSTSCQVLTHLCSVRGVFVGSREMAEEMVKAIEVGGLKPIIDQSVWRFIKSPKHWRSLKRESILVSCIFYENN
jgi:NADPH:quinone reductase-like Zn-dependent oxidoreductase